ncbi:MAG: sugar-binding domain-containing protein [Planctomycetota bacterium]
MESNRVIKWPVQNRRLFPLVLLAVLCLCSSLRAQWQPADGPLMTRWAKQVSPRNAHPEYPRPQMVRRNWLNLNGLWEYAIRPKDQQQPGTFDGDILVPYPVESALSGVMKAVGEKNRLWYRRQFEVPKKWAKQRMLLHFGAVDWDATVWVNGRKVGNHRGGYDPFTFDITEALKDTGPQEIVLSVWDPANTSYQPRGKQVNEPRGIWYTSVTGIWQSVWLEPVPEAHIKSIKIVPDIDSESVRLIAECSDGTDGYNVEAEAKDGWFTKARGKGQAGKQITLSLKKPKLWSPDSPFLYDLTVTLKDGKGKKIDSVSSYFGMRKIEIRKDRSAINRLFLNNKSLFQFGPLDQGWWPDGLYTAPTDAALRYDIEVLKKLGCNMLRKHVKVEPARLYYWCDKLGLMVWQDMPSGDKYIGRNGEDIERSEESAAQFELEWSRVIQSLHNHPCIVMWVPFNEGWGQYDTARIVDFTRELDPTRLVNQASGWADRGVGDVQDIHSYPGPAAPPTERKRAAVLGEFGGLGLPVKGHTWQAEKNWGYKSYETSEELTDAYLALIDNLRSLIGSGLAAAVYTQTTDVEIEVNGLMTYDRAMIKADAKKIAAANKQLYLPPPSLNTIVFTSQTWPKTWQYTTSNPGAGWEQPGFDDSAWKKGKAGFGTEGTPGAVVNTEWKTPAIWLRRSFDLKSTRFSRLQLLIHHDEDAEVYINGHLAAKLEGHTSGYVRVNIDEKAAKALKAGSNCLAIHCRQTSGGQYIDAGIVDVIEK